MSGLRVRHVADINPPVPGWDMIPDEETLTFLPLEAVWPRKLDYSRSRPKSDTATGYTRFMNGDVVVPKITPTFEGDRSTWINGMPTSVGTGTTELHVIRAKSADARYLDHLFSSSTFLQGGEAEMIGVAGQKRVPDDWLRDFPVPVAVVEEQRAIADYLDTETTRIDALITKKQRLIELLEERAGAAIDDCAERSAAPLVAVRRLVSKITSGPRGWAQYVSDSGTPFLRITNVDRKSIDLDMSDLLLVDPPVSAEALRTRTGAGDVLVSITADIGSVGVVPHELAGANISQHLALLRPAHCRPEWLAYAIKSTGAQAQLDAGQYGGTKTQLSLEDVASLRLPIPTISEQEVLLRNLGAVLEATWGLVRRHEQQLNLLAEHRQALITAAVTGEFRVPGMVA